MYKMTWSFLLQDFFQNHLNLGNTFQKCTQQKVCLRKEVVLCETKHALATCELCIPWTWVLSFTFQRHKKAVSNVPHYNDTGIATFIIRPLDLFSFFKHQTLPPANIGLEPILWMTTFLFYFFWDVIFHFRNHHFSRELRGYCEYRKMLDDRLFNFTF